MVKNKSICFVITNDIFTDQRIQRSKTSLTEAGYKVTILHRRKNIYRNSQIDNCQGIKTWFASGPMFYLEYNIRAFIFLLFNSYDIITSVDIDTIICCRLAAWIKRKPLVFDAHEFFIFVPELVNRPLKQRIWATIEKLFIKNLSAAYTVNQSLADIFSERYRNPFSVVRNVPSQQNNDIPTTKSLPQSNPVILIYQGAINEGRGIDIYIEAMDHLPNCELWLIGAGDLSSITKKMVERSKSKERIKLMGIIEPELLPELTAKAHIGLNMLDPKSISYYYSLANRYFDYIKAGIPAIHMDFPEYRNAMKAHKTGILISSYSIESFIKAINEIITDPRAYDEMRKICKDVFHENNWEVEKTTLIDIYNSI